MYELIIQTQVEEQRQNETGEGVTGEEFVSGRLRSLIRLSAAVFKSRLTRQMPTRVWSPAASSVTVHSHFTVCEQQDFNLNLYVPVNQSEN